MPTSQERLIAPDMQLTTIAEEEYENQIRIVEERLCHFIERAFLAMKMLMLLLALMVFVFLIGLSNFMSISCFFFFASVCLFFLRFLLVKLGTM
jgi:hypothetical protein